MNNLKERFLYFENVYKWYGEKLVLDDVDLAIAEGELCTLVGPSGCGKSTLLRLILGQERPTSGEIYLEQIPVGYPDVRRGIVYQKYSLYPHLTVLDNVLLGKKLSSASPLSYFRKRSAHQEEALQYLKRVRLADYAGRYPHELSGGMQQRVAIAQCLIMKPRVVLMDEPFGALDPGTREEMQVFLLELWNEFHMTIMFVTHDLDEAVYLGTRVLALSQFYSDGRGSGLGVRRGARILFDEALPRRIHGTLVKDTPEFRDLIQRIRRDAFDPKYLKHVKAFNLVHPDSFQTLNAEEAKDSGKI